MTAWLLTAVSFSVLYTFWSFLIWVLGLFERRGS